MSHPLVTFVVPCYKLAAFLPACLDSILAQTWTDFEVLVMDDASPDDTPAVVASYLDGRIRHVRNEQNLGHLRNYNKGIAAARGAYVWLISADDYLRSPKVLERYVDVLERHPEVGYVFCPGYGVRDGVETTIYGRLRSQRDRSRIMRGSNLLKKLLRGNFVLTPSPLVRRECYDKLGAFPLDLPWCGDWYLWCLFALHHDVAYIAEPMVCYREQHALSMTEQLTRANLAACGAEEILVARRIGEQAQRSGQTGVVRDARAALPRAYAHTVSGLRYRRDGQAPDLSAAEEALRRDIPVEREREWVRARMYAAVGNECYWRGDQAAANRCYRLALDLDPWMPQVVLKLALSRMGGPGSRIRKTILALR